MARFKADLHVHSRSARGVIREMSLLEMAVWSSAKGLDLIGTGDCLHPERQQEIDKFLGRDESGFLRSLKHPQLRFVPTTEVAGFLSQGKSGTRVHFLVVLPGWCDLRKLADSLGRPENFPRGVPGYPKSAEELANQICGLVPDSIIIPTHIFHPENSLFSPPADHAGLEGCFGRMAGEIRALETGLSADPGGCWRVKSLDGKTLVSFSDARCLRELAREFSIWEGEFSYPSLRAALLGQKGGSVFATVEYCSEMGHFFFNGHRECKIMKSPVEAKLEGNRCPVCREWLSVGTLQRILQLADRPAEELGLVQECGWIQSRRLPCVPYRKMLPLWEIIAATYGIKGQESQTIGKIYQQALGQGLTEISILLDLEESDLRSLIPAPLAEAIQRVRENRYRIQPGFDGVRGKLILFDDQEMEQFRQMILFD
jgi:PHP family Zn ribbon phosphoesterase